MKLVIPLVFSLFLANCSFNKDSKYWTEDFVKSNNDQKKMSEILKKSEDIITMELKEYEIYIDDYTKKSKYPDISQ